MKIGRNHTVRRPDRVALAWGGGLLALFVAAWLLSNPGWIKTLQRQARLPAVWAGALSPARDLPTLRVDMRFANYNRLLKERDQALQAGVYIPSANDFVTATIQLEAESVPVRLRLAPGPAERLGEDDKWGFELRTRQNALLMGMQRFYLLDPAANNWLGQWAFARALEREGVLTARYRFVRLVFNGNDRGLYALQEGFGAELSASQGRPPGVMIEYDADLLWEALAHVQGDAAAVETDPVANLSAADFQYFEVDTFRDAAIADDPVLSAYQGEAIERLRALQAGRLRASEVFDVDLYGRFLALTDVWAATHGVSLVNLRYYYNPTTDRLEPIGFNANALGDPARLSLAAMYGDARLQAAYARHAQRFSQLDYLEALQAALDPELEQVRQALAAEYAQDDLIPPWDELRDRQQQVARSLEPVQPVFAYLGSPSLAMSGTLRVEVGNILNLPVQVLGFDIGAATFLPPDPAWIQPGPDACGQRVELVPPAVLSEAPAVILRAFDARPGRGGTPVICYVRFDIPLVEIQRLDSELDYLHDVDVQVATQIWGLTTTLMTPARQGYPPLVYPPLVLPGE